MNSQVEWLAHYGYAGIFLGLVLGIVGLPVPDEVLLTFSGYLVSRGTLALLPTCAVGFLGSASGITISYILGRTLGTRVIGRFGRVLHIKPHSIERVHRWFARGGKWVLPAGYFIPGVRHLTAIVAGTSRLDARVFALFAYAGALIWSLTFILLGYRFGANWNQILEGIANHRLLATAVVGITLVAVFAVRRLWHRPPGGNMPSDA